MALPAHPSRPPNPPHTVVSVASVREAKVRTRALAPRTWSSDSASLSTHASKDRTRCSRLCDRVRRHLLQVVPWPAGCGQHARRRLGCWIRRDGRLLGFACHLKPEPVGRKGRGPITKSAFALNTFLLAPGYFRRDIYSRFTLHPDTVTSSSTGPSPNATQCNPSWP